MFYSPLRYPGGKGKLEPLMELLIKQTGHYGGTYIEPFAGGAGIALELLEKNVVKDIVINDLDKGIYSFWRAILTETDRFINDVQTVDLTIQEWQNQRAIIEKCRKYSYELGFATFYLNRTNRSGIIKGGVIGGVEQSGPWRMNARFNREDLAKRIRKIANKKITFIYIIKISILLQKTTYQSINKMLLYILIHHILEKANNYISISFLMMTILE